jgi:hypothetical protein
MVANPDLKSGFQTDSNQDLTKNWDQDFRFKTGLNLDFRFQIRFESGFQIFNSGFLNPD